MSVAAAIGEHARLAGYALAGVEVHRAEDAAAALAAWDVLGPDVACVILTPASHAALAQRLPDRPHVVWAVLPR